MFMLSQAKRTGTKELPRQTRMGKPGLFCLFVCLFDCTRWLQTSALPGVGRAVSSHLSTPKCRRRTLSSCS
ncbi:Thioredoxin H-type [Zea mays]|uniref:Thioredoxin H-type n=1 Tax=Zea mays TaxID=4577 RepID=A0A1D6MKP8_MAIZE|nr:Thioredoxin H-type [Zea mays]